MLFKILSVSDLFTLFQEKCVDCWLIQYDNLLVCKAYWPLRTTIKLNASLIFKK